LKAGGGIGVVLSDMSPHISGIRERDIAGSIELVETAFGVAEELLKPGGWFIAKIFPSPDSDLLFKRIATSFDKLQRVNLDSTRKTSNEYYCVGKGFRGRS
jgi:23S rRNA (uridine2552-2'-O)-methyltransferase